MAFTEDEIQEFKTEAEELLDSAEKGLLALDRGESFSLHYDAIFRVFHSLKGAAGMMEMATLQNHMHRLENTLTEQKGNDQLAKPFIDHFLRGSDCARQLLNGITLPFEYKVSHVEIIAPTLENVQPPVSELVRPAPLTKVEAVRLGKVLVIDDEPEIVEILVELLCESGFEVVGETSPVAAIKLLSTFQPDAVLTDVQMPALSGLDVLNAVKKFNPDLPVLFVSGHVNKDNLIEAVSLGIYGVIEKPFNPQKIMESCWNAVRKFQTAKLLNRSVNLIMYHFYDLDEFLKSKGKDDVRNVINLELKNIIDQRRELRTVKSFSKQNNRAG